MELSGDEHPAPTAAAMAMRNSADFLDELSGDDDDTNVNAGAHSAENPPPVIPVADVVPPRGNPPAEFAGASTGGKAFVEPTEEPIVALAQILPSSAIPPPTSCPAQSTTQPQPHEGGHIASEHNSLGVSAVQVDVPAPSSLSTSPDNASTASTGPQVDQHQARIRTSSAPPLTAAAATAPLSAAVRDTHALPPAREHAASPPLPSPPPPPPPPSLSPPPSPRAHAAVAPASAVSALGTIMTGAVQCMPTPVAAVVAAPLLLASLPPASPLTPDQGRSPCPPLSRTHKRARTPSKERLGFHTPAISHGGVRSPSRESHVC